MDSGEEKNILPFPGIETLLLNLLARNNVVMFQLIALNCHFYKQHIKTFVLFKF